MLMDEPPVGLLELGWMLLELVEDAVDEACGLDASEAAGDFDGFVDAHCRGNVGAVLELGNGESEDGAVDLSEAVGGEVFEIFGNELVGGGEIVTDELVESLGFAFEQVAFADGVAQGIDLAKIGEGFGKKAAEEFSCLSQGGKGFGERFEGLGTGIDGAECSFEFGEGFERGLIGLANTLHGAGDVVGLFFRFKLTAKEVEEFGEFFLGGEDEAEISGGGLFFEEAFQKWKGDGPLRMNFFQASGTVLLEVQECASASANDFSFRLSKDEGPRVACFFGIRLGRVHQLHGGFAHLTARDGRLFGRRC